MGNGDGRVHRNSDMGGESLTTWGRNAHSRSKRSFATTTNDIQALMAARPPRSLIARGLGRSYGDVCLNDGGEVVDLTRGATIRAFDGDAGIVECDAGVSLRTLTDFLLPRGWMLPVCPGTAVVTVGGAIANDVHGKEQHVHGNFGRHVIWMDLVLPDASLRRITPEHDPELFSATVAGIGLTGVIVAAAIRLVRIHSNAMDVREQRVSDMDTLLRLLTDHQSHYSHMVSWVDLLSSGHAGGRCVLELARPSERSLPDQPARSTVTVPFLFPSLALNPLSMRLFNEAYFRRVPAAGRQRQVHLRRFHFPLDVLQEWHRAYGRRGLYQFQLSVTLDRASDAIAAVRAELRRSGRGSYLAVLKLVGQHGGGMLSFSRPGMSLAMDFPGGAESVALIHRLQEITCRYDGVVYLAKDSCLRPHEFRAMYPMLPRFQALLARLDPEQRMQSDMARRLKIRET